MHPRTTSTSADSSAVPPVDPAPATSPVAVKKAEVLVFVGVTSGLPTKWIPPVRVTEVGDTANAAVAPIDASNAVVSTASTVVRPMRRLARMGPPNSGNDSPPWRQYPYVGHLAHSHAHS